MLVLLGSLAEEHIVFAQDGSEVQVLEDPKKRSQPVIIKRDTPKADPSRGASDASVPGSLSDSGLPYVGVDGPLGIERNFNPADIDLLVPPGNIKYTVDFRDAPLEEVVEFMSALMKQNYIIAATLNSKKPITIMSTKPVSVAEAYRAFLSALMVNGLTLVRSGGFYKIVEINTLGEHQPGIYGPRSRLPSGDTFVTHIIELEHIDVAQAQPIIEHFKTKNGRLALWPPTNTIILTDTSSAIIRLRDILRRIDEPANDDERVWVYQARYADASELSTTLGQIFETSGKNTKKTTSRAKRSKKGKKGKGTAVGGAEGESDVVISKIVSDERTNKLIIVANERSYDRIKRLILKLDVELPDSGRINVVHLENSDATEIAQVINQLTQELQSKKKGQKRGKKGARTSTASSTSMLSGEVSLTANKTTNDLIVVASPRDFQAIRAVIQKLDRPRKQVFVEAVILEISLDRTRDFGMALHGGNLFETDSGDSFLVGRTDLGGLQSLSAGPLFLGAGSVPGLLAAFIGPTALELGPLEIPSVSLILKALQSNSDVNVLSTPTILTLDNEEASISVGERIPFISSGGGGGLGSLAGLAGLAGGAGVDASALSGLGGLGGLGGGTQVQRIDVALKLTITPQINDAGYVRLKIKEEIEEIKPGAVELGGPTTRRRELDTTVIVKDQETVVLGGLIRDAENQSVTKVPILGDIPVIGYLFRSTTTQIQKQNLLLLLTPYIIEDESDKQKIYESKMKEREAFLQYFGARDLNYVRSVNFDKKHGLLEEMRQTIYKAEDEERNRRIGEGLLQLPERENGIQLPEGMGNDYDDAPATTTTGAPSSKPKRSKGGKLPK